MEFFQCKHDFSVIRAIHLGIQMQNNIFAIHNEMECNTMEENGILKLR